MKGTAEQLAADAVAVLTSDQGKLACKAHRRVNGGWITTGYGQLYTFDATMVPVDGLDDLAELLGRLEGDRKALVVRGRLRNDRTAAKAIRRLAHDHEGASAEFESAEHRWLCIDLDEAPAPAWLDPCSSASLRRAAAWARDTHLPSAFSGARCIYQWSASAGVKPWTKLRLHFWFWLMRPACDASIKHWFQVDGSCVDLALYSPVQVHYTAAPVFDGGQDPLEGMRSGTLDGRPEVEPPPFVVGLAGWSVVEQARKAREDAERCERLSLIDGGALRLASDDDQARYAEAALDGARCRILDAAEGTRHATIRDVANAMGNLVGAGILDEGRAQAVLERAGHAAMPGENRDVARTVADGLKNGKRYPFDVTKIRGSVARQGPPPPTDVDAPSWASRGHGSRALEQSGPTEAAGEGEHGVENLAVTPPGDDGPRRSFRLTDMGNAERFADRHRRDARFCHKLEMWVVWDGVRWVDDDTGAIERLAKRTVRAIIQEADVEEDTDRRNKLLRHMMRSETRSSVSAMLALARSEPPLPISAETFDADPLVVNVMNGILDLRTGRLQPHRRGAYCTKLAPVVYDPSATCRRFEDFLLEVMGGDAELVGYVQRFAGYCLTGDVSEHALALFYGTGANGKSTLIEALRRILGGYATHADFSSFLQKAHSSGGAASPDIVRLRGARLVSAIEADPGQRLAESVIKSLTGGDMVTARDLYQKAIEFRPQFKLVLAANHKPEIRGSDHAIWRRVHLVPFTVTIPPERRDKHLGERLAAEAQGILAWMVRGALDWQRDGLRPPASVVAATAAYKIEMDVLAPFLADRCELAEGAIVTAKELRAAYESHCEAEGERPLAPKTFARHLEERGLHRDRQAGGNRTRLWRGLRLLERGGGTPGTAWDARSQKNTLPRTHEGLYRELPSQASQASHPTVEDQEALTI